MIGYTLHLVFFFFSSRRRHTRYIGDWSSDVCSSDLMVPSAFLRNSSLPSASMSSRRRSRASMRRSCTSVITWPYRSEERRVGKECRSWWWTHHKKKKASEWDKQYGERQDRSSTITII